MPAFERKVTIVLTFIKSFECVIKMTNPFGLRDCLYFFIFYCCSCLCLLYMSNVHVLCKRIENTSELSYCSLTCFLQQGNDTVLSNRYLLRKPSLQLPDHQSIFCVVCVCFQESALKRPEPLDPWASAPFNSPCEPLSSPSSIHLCFSPFHPLYVLLGWGDESV